MNNKEKTLEYNKAYNESNKDRISEYQASYYSRRREYRRMLHFKRKYNLTIGQAEEIYSKGCEICGSFNRLNIDHDHTSGKVRGCLCNKCNQAIGLFTDNVDLLGRAINYLIRGKD
jgi:hypothetical protein